MVKLLSYAVISIVDLLNQPALASEERESPQDLIKEGEFLTICCDIIRKFPDLTKVIKVDNRIYYVYCFSVQEDNGTKYFQVFFHMKNLTKISSPLS